MTATQQLAQKATMAGFRVLSGLAPSVAARAAASLFCTPRRHTRPAAELAALGDAEEFPIRMGLTKLAGWRWGEGPAVLLVHGWEGRGSQLNAFVQPLVDAGYSVIAWDAPGHGDSPGKRSSMVEMADAIWAAGRLTDGVHGVIAHSMGCAATALAFGEGLPVERAAFVAPPSNLLQYTVQFADLLGLSEKVLQRMVTGMEERFHVRMADLDIERLDLPARVPLLVMHDEADKEVSHEQGQLVANAWPGAQFVATQGLGHRRILRTPEVVQAITAWIAHSVPVDSAALQTPSES